MSISSKPQFTEDMEMRADFTKFTPRRFRILIIGRANSGKTTILRRLCNATEEPTILSPNGEKIESSALTPSLGRGEQDIENQIIYESKPDFVFHDSRGFEAGSDQEMKLVQEFIKKRSSSENVDERLHAIWYCIPCDDDRPIARAERWFFDEYPVIGLVPAIVLWTKTDFLDLAKIKQLMKEGNSKSDAIQLAPAKAWAEFESDVFQRFSEFKYPPKAHVVFRKMHKATSGADDCKDLIEKTVAALSTEELQKLFLEKWQQNNIVLCITYGVRRVLNLVESVLLKHFTKNEGKWANFMAIVLGYFPQFVSVTLDVYCST